jgi:hypothetical protein
LLLQLWLQLRLRRHRVVDTVCLRLLLLLLRWRWLVMWPLLWLRQGLGRQLRLWRKLRLLLLLLLRGYTLIMLMERLG